MRMPRPLVALLAAALFRYPTWLFLIAGGALQKMKPSHDNYELLCRSLSDCHTYAELTEHLRPGPFFPLFPWLAHPLLPLCHGSSYLAAVVASNVFAVLAGALTLYLGERLWPDSPASRAKVLGFGKRSWMLLAAISFFRHGHFWVRGYPEPLFFLLFAGMVLALLQQRWAWAGLCSGLMAVPRPQGIWVMGAFGLIMLLAYLPGKGRERLGISVSARQWLGASALAILPFLAFLAWNREFSLLGGLKSHLPRLEDSRLYLYLSLGASWAYLRRRPGNPWFLIGLATLLMAEVPLFIGGYMSYTRFMDVSLGLFCLIVELCAERPAWFWAWTLWNLSWLATSTYVAAFGGWTG
jgi:hypothetical protein